MLVEGNTSENKKWLTATRKLFEAGRDSDSLRLADEELVRCMVEDVYHILRPAMGVEWRSDYRANHTKVFAAAQALWRRLVAQQAVYEFEMILAVAKDTTGTFQTEIFWMTGVHRTGDDINLDGRPLALSVFPAIYKVLESKGEDDTASPSAVGAVSIRRSTDRSLGKFTHCHRESQSGAQDG